jgi:hypothetical protein
MRRLNCYVATLALLTGCLLTAGTARAQDTTALINEALDKPITLELNDVLPAAMRAIANKTSVTVQADPAVWELLPWGEQTNISARIENQTLRQALSAITQKLGLTFTLGEQAVILQPMPALQRLGRRSTVQELQTLDRLSSEAMPEVRGAGTVREVLTAIDLKLAGLKVPFAIEDRLDVETRGKVVSIPRNATMADALEQISRQTRATWYPWARSVLLLPKEAQIRDMLSKTLTSRYNGADIGQVLEDLRRRAGVPVEIEPGAIQRIAPEARTVRVFWDNVTVQQALESLKGFAGIDYQVSDNGVKITNPTPAPANSTTDPVAAMLALDNGMTVFIRESQVPPELRAYLRHRAKRSIDELRQMAEAEKFPLTTQPTTKPATP